MLAIQPELVREDLAERGFSGGFSGEVIGRILRDGLETVTPNGILGDARGMSRDLGVACLEATADAIAETFRASGRPDRDVAP